MATGSKAPDMLGSRDSLRSASTAIPVDHSLAEIFREHSMTVADVSPDPWGIQASTDVRDFINSAEIPAITWGPGSLEQAHSIDEYIDLNAAEQGLTILERAVRTILTIDGLSASK